jgi:hypothetical protein
MLLHIIRRNTIRKAPLPFKMSATEHFVSLETVLEKKLKKCKKMLANP